MTTIGMSPVEQLIDERRQELANEAVDRFLDYQVGLAPSLQGYGFRDFAYWFIRHSGLVMPIGYRNDDTGEVVIG
jgi:hypothetical protein